SGVEVRGSNDPPARAAAACDPAFAHRRDDLVQRQVRLVGNQTQQKLRVLLQRRDAAAAWLCRNAAALLETMHPDHHHAGADSIAFGRLAPRGTGLHVFNHSGTQVDGIGLRHRSLQKREPMPADSLIDKALGILPILAERNLLFYLRWS